MAAGKAGAPLPKDASSEEDALLPKDSKEHSRICFAGQLLCWNEGCCKEEEISNARDAFWDNWRGLSQLFVLSLHINPQVFLTPSNVFLDSFPGRAYYGLINCVFLLCMPSFCFITGYFSTAQPKQKQIVNQVRFGLAWFIQHSFQVAMSVYSTQVQRENSWKDGHPFLNETNAQLESEGKPTLQPPGYIPVQFFSITGVDWYLWCVVIWRCVLPMLALLQHSLPISFCIAFMMMWTDASNTVYSHAPFGFLPFFVGGFLLKTRSGELEAWRNNIAVKACFWGLCFTIVAATVYKVELRDHVWSGVACLYGGGVLHSIRHNDIEYMRGYEMTNETLNDPHPTLPPESTFCQTPIGLLHVALTYIWAFAMIISVMSVIPTEKKPVLTKAGVNSIYIYFGHMFFGMVPVMAVAFAFWHFKIVLNSWITVAFMLSSIVVVLACLSQQWLRCFCKPFVEPDVETCCLARNKDEP